MNAVATTDQVDATTEVPEVVEPTQVPDAPVAKSDGKYASEDDAKLAAQRVLAARDAGWSRTSLQELTELTPAQLWRIEQGRMHAHEAAQLNAALDKIDAGELVAPAKKGGKISESQSKINAALAILTADRPKATKAELVDVIAEAVAALDPQPEVEVDESVVEENQD